MAFSIGLDVGGTKIAGAVFGEDGREITRVIQPTPKHYEPFLEVCVKIVAELDAAGGAGATIGIGLPGAVAAKPDPLPNLANVPCLGGRHLQADLQKLMGRSVRLANDADCAALSEAIDGAGQGFHSVFGLIMGTGVGGGVVVNGQLVQGVNGLTGEFGHLPLPYREADDGPVVSCSCGQSGCIDKSASGPALLRLHHMRTGQTHTASPQIGELARQGDKDALATLDRFYITVAKAMVPVLHMFDPDVIVVCGGLNSLPGLIESVPRHWAKFTMIHSLQTRFVAAKHGAMSGLRGAAWLGQQHG